MRREEGYFGVPCGLRRATGVIMAALVSAIHAFAAKERTWMPGTSPGMTRERQPLDLQRLFRFNFQTATLSDVVARRLSPTGSGMTGRCSIPEALVLEPRGRGVLDAPHARGTTTEGEM
jgi:hypothetical protein